MGIIDYEGKSYELTPTDAFGSPCFQCDLFYKHCAEADPEFMCFDYDIDGMPLVFKEIPIGISIMRT